MAPPDPHTQEGGWGPGHSCTRRPVAGIPILLRQIYTSEHLLLGGLRFAKLGKADAVQALVSLAVQGSQNVAFPASTDGPAASEIGSVFLRKLFREARRCSVGTCLCKGAFVLV